MKNNNMRNPQHAQMLRAFRAAEADGEFFPKPDEVIIEGAWSDLLRTNTGLSQQDKRKIERAKQRKLKYKTLDF
jgi:hypothetical protein